MDSRLLIACDLHNTILLSSQAWEKAFIDLSSGNEERISNALAGKVSRHQLAESLGVNYEDVYQRYCELVDINAKVVSVISILQIYFPVVLISSASLARVERDIRLLNNSIRFERIYTKETFQKACPSDWEKLRNEFGAKMILFFGNDPAEDTTSTDFVQSVLV